MCLFWGIFVVIVLDGIIYMIFIWSFVCGKLFMLSLFSILFFFWVEESGIELIFLLNVRDFFDLLVDCGNSDLIVGELIWIIFDFFYEGFVFFGVVNVCLVFIEVLFNVGVVFVLINWNNWLRLWIFWLYGL